MLRPVPQPKPRLTIGVIELLTDTRSSGWVERTYAHWLTKQFASITPQAVSIWCRQLGHRVHYATYYGQADPRSLLPRDLDVLFVSAYTRSSGLAYALATLFRREGTRTGTSEYSRRCARDRCAPVWRCRLISSGTVPKRLRRGCLPSSDPGVLTDIDSYSYNR